MSVWDVRASFGYHSLFPQLLPTRQAESARQRIPEPGAAFAVESLGSFGTVATKHSPPLLLPAPDWIKGLGKRKQ